MEDSILQGIAHQPTRLLLGRSLANDNDENDNDANFPS